MISLKSRLANYHARWNVKVSESEALGQFRNRALNALDRLAGQFLLANPELSDRLSYLLGAKLPFMFKGGMRDTSAVILRCLGATYTQNDQFYSLLDNAASMTDLTRVLQHIFWVLEEGKFPHMAELSKAVDQAAQDSPLVGIRVSARGSGAVVYPAGVRFLDDRVINDTVDWLASYPGAAKQFSHALETFLAGQKSDYRVVLDDLRHCLEQFLRTFLKNRSRLEKQGKPLQTWLETLGVEAYVVEMYKSFLFRFCDYQNANVKHGDRHTGAEVEFMIYLTGTLIHFLLQVERRRGA